MMLGDLGADVIKVEGPRGDLSRDMRSGDNSSAFLAYNRSKRSIGLDLRSTGGKKVMERLVASADVMLDGFRPGVLDRLGFDWANLVRLNPRLVRVSISGYGTSGPHGHRRGVDAVVQGESGIMALTGLEEGDPTRVGFPVIDAAAGLVLTQAVFAGLRLRDRTGKPQHLSTTLLEVGAFLQAPAFVGFSLTGKEPLRQGATAGTYGYPSDMFATADGKHVMVAAYFPDQWIKLCEMLGLIHLTTDPRFSDNSSRLANQDELRTLLQEVFKTMTAESLSRQLSEAGLLGGPVLNISDVIAHPQLEHNQSFVDLEVGGTPYRSPRLPLRGEDWCPEPQSPPPDLGEHTRDILEDMGFSPEEIQELLVSGAAIAAST
jgi:crotonobetainyl-CoA:carnitine CoA-transferase CaiB-like acyl-CoA transferase